MQPRLLLALGLATLTLSPVSSAATAAVRTSAPGASASASRRWAQIPGVAAEEVQSEDGFTCHIHTIIDRRNGDWRKTVRCPLFTTARGIDAHGAWREDRSGWVHSLDSPEARKLTVTDRWLSRIGPYLPMRPPGRVKRLPAATLDHASYRRTEIKLHGGRSVTLWTGGAGALIARTVMRRSFQTATTEYSAYRPVDGVMLPFRVTSRVGAAAAADVETVSRYQLLRSIPARALERPADATDAQVPAAGTRIPLAFSDDGKLLVEAKINGRGPFPFVLDTGGHAILTPAAASELRLEVRGHSVSYGAGAGSTALGYTRVHSIRLGGARIDDQSMLVMPLSPVLTDRGSQTPVAGILGLEVFERFAVTVDPAKRTITLQPLDTFRPPAGAIVLPIRFTSDMPLVIATLDGARGIFGLDTGNSGPLMLFPGWAARHDLARYYEAGYPMQEGGEGGMFIAHMAYVHSLRIGGRTILGELLGVLTPPGAGSTSNPSEAGNLGMTVWRAFRSSFDYRDGRLYLTARPDYAPPGPPRASGGFIAVKLAHQAFSVVQVVPRGPAAKAGLKIGDRIVAVDGRRAESLASLYLMKYFHESRPGAVLRLTLSNGRTMAVALSPNTAMLRALRPPVQ